MPTFQARWPITDDTLRISELIVEGATDLPAVAERAGVVLTGDPTWSVDGTTLIATVSANPIPDAPRKPGPKPGAPVTAKARAANRRNGAALLEATRARAAAIHERIELALDEHAELSNWELAQLVGVSERTVQRHLAKIRQETAA